MWRLAVMVIMATGLAFAALASGTPEALACSAGDDFDPVATADTIVEGRLSEVEVLPDAAPPGAEGVDFTADAFVPIRVDMDVTQALKGTGGASVAIVDYRTYGVLPDGTERWGGGGSCGAFGEDPSGKYAILGLNAHDDGTYGPNLLRVFYLGEEPSGEEYSAALARLASFAGADELPALGSGNASTRTVPAEAAAGIAAIGAALVLAGLAIKNRTRGSV